MTDDNDSGRSNPAQGGRAPLTLKPRLGGSVSAGMVKQSFSHGRSKTVVVETKRRRVDAPGVAPAAVAERRGAFEVRGAPPPRPQAPAQPAPPARPQTAAAAAAHGLSEDERRARQRVIEEAARRAQEQAVSRDAEAPPPRPAPEPVAEAPAPQPVEAPQPLAAPEPVAVAEPVHPAPPAEPVRRPVEASRPTPASRLPTAPGQTRTYEPSRERRDDRPTTTTYRPDRAAEGVAFNQRVARSEQGGFGARPSRDERPRDGAGQGPRPARPGETVRYSANAPRPARDAVRPGGPRPAGARPAAAPAEPEFQRASRQTPRPGSLNLDRRPDFDDEDAKKARAGGGAGKAVSRTRGEPRRREGRLTIQAVAGDDEGAIERMRSLASVRRAREREREKRRGGGQESAKAAREVVIPDVITVQELAGRMAVRAVEIIKFLAREGLMLKATDVIESDTAELVATEFGHTVRRVSESDVETGFLADEDIDDHLLPRPPVVAVMGHVDHGKTSLLDALRSTDVAAGEHGGITQHIGAYQVRLADGDRVTFLDTPGHAAFSAMRARGANVTDIVVLVVAADDGVMPQTIEAIQHAKAADAPLIVAINKVDKPGADPTRVINELLQHEVVAESLGGETQTVEVSALKKTGLDELLEAILLQAEVMDLRANPDRTAEGVVIEAKLDRGRGAVATVLVKRGTLKRGEIVVAGEQFGRVRALLNERDEQVEEAGPSTPVEILGLDGAPSPGEAFAVVESEARARELTDYRIRQKRERNLTPVGAAPGVSLADMMAKLANKKVSELPLVIKADVQGSAEAIVGALDRMATDEVRVRTILSGAGGINESDVMLAKGAGASVIGFNVRASKQARDLAEREGVEIRYYAIIYDLIDDIKGVLSGMLAPIQRESFLGNAEVLQAFDISKVGRVAGCRVREGVVRRGARVRIIRNDVVVLELGTLQTLKRFKDDVAEVQAGYECGMAFAGFQDIQAGDQIECFTVEEVKRTL
jgi:translation initiation factor IF-2